jgi:hypothetical protein
MRSVAERSQPVGESTSYVRRYWFVILQLSWSHEPSTEEIIHSARHYCILANNYVCGECNDLLMVKIMVKTRYVLFIVTCMSDYRQGLGLRLDLLTIYTHELELQAITTPPLLSTIHKSPQHPLSIFQPVFTNRSLATASCAEVLSSQTPVQNWLRRPSYLQDNSSARTT